MSHFIPAAKPQIGEAERRAVDRVMQTGMIAQGPEVAEFEKEFSQKLLDGRESVAVSSGTSGLHLGLLACGVGPGDEIIVPSFTFAATANSVALTGASPVFVDIEPRYFNIDPAKIAAAITPRTKGIMPVHLYGHPANMPELTKIAEEYNLLIFEDAAQAHGASIQDKKVGTFGAFAMFSLYPTKNMTSGEGGMVSTDNASTARHLRLLRNQGMETRYENEIIGFNNRMTDIHAAIGRAQLELIGARTKVRQENAKKLSEIIDASAVVTPSIAEGYTHVFHQYTIRIEGQRTDRDEISTRLKDDFNIGSGVYYPIPSHQLPSFDTADILPETLQACDQVLSLPVYPGLSDADLERIGTAINSLINAGA